MHPALQDESHPAAADFYILFFYSPYFHDPPDPPDLPTYFSRFVWRALGWTDAREEFVTKLVDRKGLKNVSERV